MKPSIIFRLNRSLKFILQGVGKKENEHFLFLLPKPMTDLELYQVLADVYQPNYGGYIYAGQVYQCRCIEKGGEFQYHLRFYDTGLTTGHREIAPEFSVKRHLKGTVGDLRTMTPDEAKEVWKLLCGDYDQI